jgi:hypothetical protein
MMDGSVAAVVCRCVGGSLFRRPPPTHAHSPPHPHAFPCALQASQVAALVHVGPASSNRPQAQSPWVIVPRRHPTDDAAQGGDVPAAAPEVAPGVVQTVLTAARALSSLLPASVAWALEAASGSPTEFVTTVIQVR